MQAHGEDRVRFAGGRAILLSQIPKGWTARVAKQGTHSEHPGTAVMWDGECFEVLAAEPTGSRNVRYVLAPWMDEHVIRQLDHYDEESEARRVAEYKAVMRQQKQSAAASLSGIVLGHLPAVVQNRLSNELGLSAAGMTIVSCIPPVVFLGICVYVTAGATLEKQTSPVPLWLMFVAGYLLIESAIRFHIAMSQNRGVGSAAGFLLYVFYWLVIMGRRPEWSPFVAERGNRLFMLPPSEERARRDAVEWLGPLFSLLRPRDQMILARHHGYEYRRHAFGLTWTILIVCGAGAITSLQTILERPTVSAMVSFLLAAFLAVEQVVRLQILRTRPAGSLTGLLVRPFLRRFLGDDTARAAGRSRPTADVASRQKPS